MVVEVREANDEDDLLLCAVALCDDWLTVAARTANWSTIASVSLEHSVSLLDVRVTCMPGVLSRFALCASSLTGALLFLSGFSVGYVAVSTSRLKYWRLERIARRRDHGARGLRRMRNIEMMDRNPTEVC